jgi:hypothetical protein
MTGDLTIGNDDDTVLTVDRATSDGTIIDVQKDGTTVGSIGVNNGTRIYIGSGDANLTFNPVGNYVFPSTPTGEGRDAQLDLGLSTARFKNLYLSGGVYLGGTELDNKLDSYEEGTWQPVIGGYNAGTGYYTKIGQEVFIQVDINVNASAATTNYITGLPFTANSQKSVWYTGLSDQGVQCGYFDNNGTGMRAIQPGGTIAKNFQPSKRTILAGMYIAA